MFSSEGARWPPSPGHLRGRGLGAWRDRRGGGPLKYLSLFPQLSLKGTQSYPARPWGQPRLEVQRAAPWGGGRGGEGLSQVSIRPWRTRQVPRLFFSSPSPITARWICVSTSGQPEGEASGSLWTQASWARGAPRRLQELGCRQGSLDRGSGEPVVAGTGLCCSRPSCEVGKRQLKDSHPHPSACGRAVGGIGACV